MRAGVLLVGGDEMIAHTEFKSGVEGVFNIPSDLYHDHAAAPEISRSLIVEMVVNTPAHVRAVLDGKRIKKPTRAMIIGTLMDCALLEPDKFKEGVSHWVRPEGMRFTTKEGKAWKAEHDDLPIIQAKNNSETEASAEDIEGMIASVMAHKQARKIVESSVKQESAFCFHGPSGLLRKCRPDTRLSELRGRLVLSDLKTTFPGGTSAAVFSAHAARLGYHVQDPFYSDIYQDLLGEKPFFLFFVVERKPPYSVRVFQIHDEGKQAGRTEYQRALDRFAECKSSGIWPAHPEEIEVIRLPRWALSPPDPIVVE